MRQAVFHHSIHHDPVIAAPCLQIAEPGFSSFKNHAPLKPVQREIAEFHSRAKKITITLRLVFRPLDFSFHEESSRELC